METIKMILNLIQNNIYIVSCLLSGGAGVLFSFLYMRHIKNKNINSYMSNFFTLDSRVEKNNDMEKIVGVNKNPMFIDHGPEFKVHEPKDNSKYKSKIIFP